MLIQMDTSISSKGEAIHENHACKVSTSAWWCTAVTAHAHKVGHPGNPTHQPTHPDMHMHVCACACLTQGMIEDGWPPHSLQLLWHRKRERAATEHRRRASVGSTGCHTPCGRRVCARVWHVNTHANAVCQSSEHTPASVGRKHTACPGPSSSPPSLRLLPLPLPRQQQPRARSAAPVAQ